MSFKKCFLGNVFFRELDPQNGVLFVVQEGMFFNVFFRTTHPPIQKNAGNNIKRFILKAFCFVSGL